MRKTCFFLIAAALLFACEPGQPPAQASLLNEITDLEKQLVATKEATKHREIALQLIDKTMLYAKTYPQHKYTPALLFKAGETAKSDKEFGKAVELWGLVWRDYPKHQFAPMALFLQGQTFDANLNDPTMAAKYYQQLLESYPNDTAIAKQVKQRLQVIKAVPALAPNPNGTE